jgi:hypothetical protein
VDRKYRERERRNNTCRSAAYKYFALVLFAAFFDCHGTEWSIRIECYSKIASGGSAVPDFTRKAATGKFVAVSSLPGGNASI